MSDPQHEDDPTDDLAQPRTESLGDGRSPILEERVLSELLAARKTSEGLTVAVMARLPTLTALLGDGDPERALRTLMNNILVHLDETDDPLGLTGAVYSLGLAQELDARSDTHLARLEAFGDKFSFEQRQARRHSDRGLRELTKLITGHWFTHTQPRMDVVLVAYTLRGTDYFALHIDLHTRAGVPMRPPRLAVDVDRDDKAEYKLDFYDSPSHPDPTPGWQHQMLVKPIRLPFQASLRLSLRWGPLWPKLTLMVTGDVPRDADVVLESGGRVMGVSVIRQNPGK
jgi:hypothetical protein